MPTGSPIMNIPSALARREGGKRSPIIEAANPSKDVDGFHPTNVGLLALGRPRFVPCTPAGIIELLDRNQIEVAGANACVVWTTDGFPANNDGDADEGLRKVGTTLANGTVFRIIEFSPGVAARNHRTDSIDYIVIISGEIDMELDDSVVQLKAGDVMVQRGTIHNWVNRGPAPCVLAVILIAAKSVEAGGKVLNAAG